MGYLRSFFKKFKNQHIGLYKQKCAWKYYKKIKMDKTFQENLDDFEQGYNFKYSQSIM